MTAKIKWTVDPPPTGPHRSFFHRGWPTGTVRGAVVAQINCPGGYRPADARTGQHPPLTIRVTVPNDVIDHAQKGPWSWKQLKGTFATLDEAKTKAQAFWGSYPKVLDRRIGHG